MASDRYALAPRPHLGKRPADRAAHLAELRFLVFGRAIPGVLFGFLALLVWQQQVAPGLQGWSGRPLDALTQLGPQVTYLVFCGLPAVIYLTRPMPKASDTRWMVRAGAFGGAIGQIIAGVAVSQQWIRSGPKLWSVGDAGSVLGSLILVTCFLFAIYGMAYLRRCLSIVPEARRLVTGGPYRWVRNPLYLAEIAAAVTRVALSPDLLALVVLAVFVSLQLCRLHWEEGLLSRTFPVQYSDYAARTARLVPGVW